MKRPNFFIVSAPKCGTTALYTYLRQHPALFKPHKDLKRDAEGVYTSSLQFLGAGPDDWNGFAVVDPNTERRSRWLAQHMAVPYPAVRQLVRMLVPSIRWRRRLGRGVNRLNTESLPREPMDRALRRRLTEELAPEVRSLGELIDRDLSAWQETGNR